MADEDLLDLVLDRMVAARARSSWNPNCVRPIEQQAVNRAVNAGVRNTTPEIDRSASSSMTALLGTAIPTNVMSMWRAGRTEGPKVGEYSWAFVYTPTRTVSPRCTPRNRAACCGEHRLVGPPRIGHPTVQRR